MTTLNTSVIFTAFANPDGDLDSLNEEQNGIQDVLMPLEKEGKLTKHLIRTDMDLGAFFEFMGEWKNQISIFHYAGHATSRGLSLQDAPMYFNPLAKELAQRNPDSLKLVFLNGCSTLIHIQKLFDLGVKAVLATSVDIEDNLACMFSLRFYKNIAKGDTIKQAYLSACNFAETQSDEDRFRNFGKITTWTPEAVNQTEEDDFPWGLYVLNKEALDNPVLVDAQKTGEGKTITQNAEKIYNIDKIEGGATFN